MATIADAFLGRQPIFDRRFECVAYELLFRSKDQPKVAEFDDGTLATACVISRAFAEFGIDNVVGQSRAFINVNAELLLSHYIEALPADRVVLEILESVDIDERVIHRCRKLKRLGYLMALDDIVRYRECHESLLDVVDIVKIDLLNVEPSSLLALVARMKAHRLQMVAEKVDSAERLHQCLKLGFEMFQGFLLGRPTVLTA